MNLLLSFTSRFPDIISLGSRCLGQLRIAISLELLGRSFVVLRRIALLVPMRIGLGSLGLLPAPAPFLTLTLHRFALSLEGLLLNVDLLPGLGLSVLLLGEFALLLINLRLGLAGRLGFSL